MRPIRPMRIVARMTQVAPTRGRWTLHLQCGHDVVVEQRTRPTRKFAPCPRCAASSTRGDVHAGCGGTWGKPEGALESSMPGLVDRCTKCGEERA